jgi:ABC-type uncharacterized transport system permease subunit
MCNTLLGSLAAVLYLLTGSLLGVRLSQAGTGKAWNKAGLVALGWGAVVLHAAILSQLMIRPEGINLGFFNALTFSGWLTAVLLLASAITRPVENLGIILLPFSAATLILALAFPTERIIGDSSYWPLELHILIAILAYASLALAAMQAVLLAVQDRHLRSRHPGGFIRGIPPLITMEKLLFQMIRIGFVLLSLTLASGFLFLDDIFAQHLVHKMVLSIAAWAVFGTLLWGRWRFGWRGRTAIRWTLCGFAALVLAYFGSKLVLELVLRRV